MSRHGWARRCAVGVLLCVSLTGCFPAGDSQLDEKKEPNFINGKSLVGQMDFRGAIDAYEKALEVNPQSASAHFELGWLYEEKGNDPAAAIYHYDRYLKFSSNPGNADVVKQRINNCKLELVKTVSAVGPMASPALREMDRLSTQNRDLQTQVADLQAQLAQAKSAMATRAQTPAPIAAVTPTRPPIHIEPVHAEKPRVTEAPPRISTSNHATSSKRLGTHTIKPGETLASVARKYGISISAMEAANPHVKPAHLVAGQTLNIPMP